MHKLASFGQKPRSINQSNFYMNIPDSKLFSLIPDLKTPVVSYTYLHQFDSTKGTFQSRFFRIKLGRNKNRVSNFRGKISAKLWNMNRFEKSISAQNISNFQNFLSIVSHVRKTFPRSIVRTTNFHISESHYILRQEDWIALCMDIRGIFPPKIILHSEKITYLY